MMNFVHESTSQEDLELFFGPLDNEEFTRFDDDVRVEHLVIMLGKFKSVTQARKNNWSGDIPKGFKAWKIGKTHFWTFDGRF